MKTIERTAPFFYAVFSAKTDPAVPPGVARMRLVTFETIDLEAGDDDLKFEVLDWNRPEMKAFKTALNPLEADEQFLRLVAVMAKAHAADNTPPTVAVEGFDEIEDHFDMLQINIEDDDRAEVMLQNCASLIGAAHRFAQVLLKDITPEQLAAIIEENQP